jgi:hypothetical protein
MRAGLDCLTFAAALLVAASRASSRGKKGVQGSALSALSWVPDLARVLPLAQASRIAECVSEWIQFAPTFRQRLKSRAILASSVACRAVCCSVLVERAARFLLVHP